MISLGSLHLTRKKPFRVTLKSLSFTLGMSLISIPEIVFWVVSSKLGVWLTNADLSERVVGEGVLAVAVRDGDGHPPVTHPRGELGPGAGVFLRANEKLCLRYNQIVHTIDWVTDSWETQKWMMMMKSELTMYMIINWDPLQPSTCLSRARHVMLMWWTVSH